MGLKLNLRTNERIVINGAVITALKPTSILINNQVAMLLERQIMRPENANTPAKHIYFAIQCAYMAEPAEKPRYLATAEGYISEFSKATSLQQTQELLGQIRRHVAAGTYYDALKLCLSLMEIEDKLLNIKAPEPTG
jgi:flagellar protein FlbT